MPRSGIEQVFTSQPLHGNMKLTLNRRYEVQDVDDDNGVPGEYARSLQIHLLLNLPIKYFRIYRTGLKNIQPLPDPDAHPSDPSHVSQSRPFHPGASVLALYPDTTSFYRAEVISAQMGQSDRVTHSTRVIYHFYTNTF